MLSEEQRTLLRRAIEQYAPTLVSLTFGDATQLPLEQRNQLRSALGDYLSVAGFDKDWVPTSLGREIEQLIDVLGPK